MNSPYAVGSCTVVIALDELLVPAPVLDQVGDGDQLQPVPLAVRDQVGDARHRPVLVHDLADDARRDQPREAREVDRRLGLAGAQQHAAVTRAQREDMAGLDEIVAAVDCGSIATWIVRDAIRRRDARRHALARLDRDRERRAVRRLVASVIWRSPSCVAAVLRQAQADQPARLPSS